MSERYGTPGELKEILEDFEDWVREEIDKARERLDSTNQDTPRGEAFTAGRLDAFRDVLSWLEVDQP
jgi:hypothetical protein